MATFSVNTTNTSNQSGFRYISAGGGQYDYTHAFTKIDLSSYGWAVGDISAVSLNWYVTSISGGTQTHRIQTANDDTAGWGTTLEATAGDFYSCEEFTEGDISISATGWQSLSINKNNLNLSGYTYFRWRLYSGGTGNSINQTFSSQNASSNKPYLRVTTGSGSIVLIPMTGAGVAGATSDTDVQGPTGDGWVRATTTAPEEYTPG